MRGSMMVIDGFKLTLQKINIMKISKIISLCTILMFLSNY